MSLDNTAKRCVAICPLFEAELLLHLMLDKWGHPFATEEHFRQGLLESATEVLMTASDDACTEVFIDGMPTQDMNLVSAVWYAEFCATQDDTNERELRQKWLHEVRRSLPSCFCKTDLLES